MHLQYWYTSSLGHVWAKYKDKVPDTDTNQSIKPSFKSKLKLTELKVRYANADLKSSLYVFESIQK